MACSQSTVQGWEDCAGVSSGLLGYPGLNVPASFDSQYTIVAKRNRPSGTSPNFYIPCEANLRARGLIYYKSNPGDCGGGSLAPGGVSAGQIVGLSGVAASGVIGGIGAAGILSGAATFGIGSAVTLAVAGIQDIFAHHAQAVANEQATICKVANFFNPVLRQIDRAVEAGAISPDQGITYVRQLTMQAINGLQSIYKPCNAACYFIGYLRAHADLVSSLYSVIAPAATGIFAQAPGSAPVTFGTPPGGVPDTGIVPAPIRSLASNTYSPAGPGAVGGIAPAIEENRLLPSGNTCSMGSAGAISWQGAGCSPDYLNRGYNQQTGQSGQAADVPPSIPINFTTILLGLLALILLAVFL